MILNFYLYFYHFLEFFYKRNNEEKNGIVHETQKCRFLKRFFDQKCRFLKRNNDVLNEILNFQNNDDNDKNEIFFLFMLSNKN